MTWQELIEEGARREHQAFAISDALHRVSDEAVHEWAVARDHWLATSKMVRAVKAVGAAHPGHRISRVWARRIGVEPWLTAEAMLHRERRRK